MSDWETTTLGEVATGFLSGGTPTTKRFDYWEGQIPWITSKWLGKTLELITGEKFVSEAAIKNTSAKIVPKDSIIFATRVGVGKVGVNRLDLAINQDLAGILVDNENYDIMFLAYQLGIDSIQQYIAMNKRGATIKGITRDCLEQVRLSIPPLREQKEIAHILSTVQRAIEAQERIIQTTTELKKALMHKLFTEGLRNEPQKQTEIGRVPESWELLSIGELFETQLGKMLSQKAKVGDSPKAYLRNKNVQWGRIDTDDLLRMDFNDREAEKFRLQKGDLLICEGGEVGRAALWDGSMGECYYQKALHRLRPKTDQITNEFMIHWMMFAFLLTNTYGVTGTRTTIAHLPEIKLKPLLVPVPSPDEQAEIAAAIGTVVQKHATHQRKLETLQDLFRTLLHELMAAKIQVHGLSLPKSMASS